MKKHFFSKRCWGWVYGFGSLVLVCCCSDVNAQSPTTGLDKILAFPEKLSGSIDRQQEKVSKELNRQKEKYVRKMMRQEISLRKKLNSMDSVLAKELQLGNDSLYRSTEAALTQLRSTNAYSGKVDSMTMAIQFLQKQAGITNPELLRLKDQYHKLGAQIGHLEDVKRLLQDRRSLLQDKLSGLGFSKELAKYTRQSNYYQQQIREYRKALENPQILEKKALEVLSQVPAFRKYFDKFSQLGGMFRLPGQVEDMDPSTLLDGLQTRSSVLAGLNSRFSDPAAAQQAVSEGLQAGQEDLTGIKDKLLRSLGNGESLDMPGFTPNPQKTKTFFKRLEPGFNLQSSRANGLFPVTSDLGLSVGYKLSPKAVIGLGLTYKIGWGKDIRHINITHQGMGLRSFIDVRIKWGFWLTGGAEWNYLSQFQNLLIVKDLPAWQKSALFGVQQKKQLGKYKITASLLYDALWKQHIPAGQALKFRVGYLF